MSVDKLDLHKKNERELTKTSMIQILNQVLIPKVITIKNYHYFLKLYFINTLGNTLGIELILIHRNV